MKAWMPVEQYNIPFLQMPFNPVSRLNLLYNFLFQVRCNSFSFSIRPYYVICTRISLALYKLLHHAHVLGCDRLAHSYYLGYFKRNSNLINSQVRVRRDDCPAAEVYYLSCKIMPYSSLFSLYPFGYCLQWLPAPVPCRRDPCYCVIKECCYMVLQQVPQILYYDFWR